MRVVAVYRENAEMGSEVKEYIREFEARTGKVIDEMNPDTTEGQIFCEARDIMIYPSFVAVDDAGRVIDRWTGDMLPRINEMSFYAATKEDAKRPEVAEG